MKENRHIAVLGLGGVGLEIAIAFSSKHSVIGYDISAERITQLKSGIDINGNFEKDELSRHQILLTTDSNALAKANFYIVTVPTQIDQLNNPDLQALISISTTLAQYLKKGDIVVYESSIFPGGTEEVCIPILERKSTLKAGKDFHVGYSPERVNFGDKEHTVTNTTKIIAAQDTKTAESIKAIYKTIITSELKQASSIRVAEAAKIVENIYRDVNIALTNEIAIIMKKLNINTREVLELCATKWNVSTYEPGLVGGHCIPVNPHYLMYKTRQLGYFPEIIMTARKLNHRLGEHIAQETIKMMTQLKINPTKANVAILGVTYKENYPDVKGSCVLNVAMHLKNLGIENFFFHDPIAHPDSTKKYLDIDLTKWEDLKNISTFIILIPHQFYKNIPLKAFTEKFHRKEKLLIDLKSIMDSKECKKKGVELWSL